MVKKSKLGSPNLRNAVLWLRGNNLITAETNKEIAEALGFSEGMFSQIYSGNLAASLKFIKAFENYFLRQHNYKWEDFVSGVPAPNGNSNVPEDVYLQAIKEVYGKLIKELHDKVDTLTALVKELNTQLKKG